MNEKNIPPANAVGAKTKWLLISGTALFAVLAGMLGWLYFDPLAGSAEGTSDPARIDWMFIDAGDADLVIAGRKVYEANCASCHGFGLEGQPDWRQRGPDGVLPAPPHNETGHTRHHHDALLFDIVKLGGQALMPQGVTSGMPAYGDVLNDREIESSLAYIKSRWPGKIRRQQEMRTDKSR